jgi:hypothetical protein
MPNEKPSGLSTAPLSDERVYGGDPVGRCPNCGELERRVLVLESQLSTQAASTRALAVECDRLRHLDLRVKDALTGAR